MCFTRLACVKHGQKDADIEGGWDGEEGEGGGGEAGHRRPRQRVNIN